MKNFKRCELADVYIECPEYKSRFLTLRKTEIGDAEGLLKCYSDERAVPFFISICLLKKYNKHKIYLIDK